MPIISNPELYNAIKKEADKIYLKPSAYKSGWIVKEYKKNGGEYIDDNKPRNLARWFKEDWSDIGDKEYPVYRPTKRINNKTPLTATEIDPEQLREQIKLKQIIKGDFNLPPFKRGGSMTEEIQKEIQNYNAIIKHLTGHIKEGNFDPLDIKQSKYLIKEVERLNNILHGGIRDKIEWSPKYYKYSNPEISQEKAFKYLGANAILYPSNKKDKKYMIETPDGHWIHFGQFPYDDYNKHGNMVRRKSYLLRTANMRGDWKNDPYSANNLSRNILW